MKKLTQVSCIGLLTAMLCLAPMAFAENKKAIYRYRHHQHMQHTQQSASNAQGYHATSKKHWYTLPHSRKKACLTRGRAFALDLPRTAAIAPCQ